MVRCKVHGHVALWCLVTEPSRRLPVYPAFSFGTREGELVLLANLPSFLRPSQVPAQGRTYKVMVSWGQGDLRWAPPQPGYGHPFHHSITCDKHSKKHSAFAVVGDQPDNIVFFSFPLFFHSSHTDCLNFQGNLLFSAKFLAGHLWY